MHLHFLKPCPLQDVICPALSVSICTFSEYSNFFFIWKNNLSVLYFWVRDWEQESPFTSWGTWPSTDRWRSIDLAEVTKHQQNRFTQSALNLNTGWSHPTTPPSLLVQSGAHCPQANLPIYTVLICGNCTSHWTQVPPSLSPFQLLPDVIQSVLPLGSSSIHCSAGIVRGKVQSHDLPPSHGKHRTEGFLTGYTIIL